MDFVFSTGKRESRPFEAFYFDGQAAAFYGSIIVRWSINKLELELEVNVNVAALKVGAMTFLRRTSSQWKFAKSGQV